MSLSRSITMTCTLLLVRLLAVAQSQDLPKWAESRASSVLHGFDPDQAPFKLYETSGCDGEGKPVNDLFDTILDEPVHLKPDFGQVKSILFAVPFDTITYFSLADPAKTRIDILKERDDAEDETNRGIYNTKPKFQWLDGTRTRASRLAGTMAVDGDVVTTPDGSQCYNLRPDYETYVKSPWNYLMIDPIPRCGWEYRNWIVRPDCAVDGKFPAPESS